jgi:peptidoglycan/LPS O-acetylase OafA/YrhL
VEGASGAFAGLAVPDLQRKSFCGLGRNQAFSNAWSLCIEEQFYLLRPLLVLLMLRRPSLQRMVLVLGGLVAAGMAARVIVFFHVLLRLGVDGAGQAYLEQI